MNNLIKLLPVILIISTACSQKEAIKPKSPNIKPVLAADAVSENNGLIATSSPYDVAETSDRIENIIKEKGLTVFTRINHSDNAANVELDLNPTEVLIFGNPKVGTPLMKCSATTAIDLPQKILVYEDTNNQTQVIYNDPAYLQQRHNINGCDRVLEKVSGVLKTISTDAIQ